MTSSITTVNVHILGYLGLIVVSTEVNSFNLV